MAEVAIVGAGVAGLAAGRELQRAGHSVRLFEKSRGVGGRAATRRMPGFRFDHGAQYMKAPTPELAALAAASGAVDIGRPVWVFDGQGQISPGDPELNAEPKWTWPGGITALARHLAEGLQLSAEATVGSIAVEPGAGAPLGRRFWLRDSAGAALAAADALLLTPPAAQSAAIIAASEGLEPARRSALVGALEAVRYRRCIAISLAFASRPALPWYAIVNTDRRHPVSWLACEHDKPGRAPDVAGLLVAQMAPGWSEEHWDALAKGSYDRSNPPPAPALAAQQMALDLVGQELGEPRWLDVQRWRYALPDTAADLDGLNAAGDGLYLAGDMAAGQGRLHLAIESGWRTAARIVADLAAG